MAEGDGPDAGIRANFNALISISEDMVGPGLTWIAPQASFDLVPRGQDEDKDRCAYAIGLFFYRGSP
jgi:hypothetical protein